MRGLQRGTSVLANGRFRSVSVSPVITGVSRLTAPQHRCAKSPRTIKNKPFPRLVFLCFQYEIATLSRYQTHTILHLKLIKSCTIKQCHVFCIIQYVVPCKIDLKFNNVVVQQFRNILTRNQLLLYQVFSFSRPTNRLLARLSP